MIFRIGLTVIDTNTGATVCNPLIKPSKLLEELEIIKDYKNWEVKEVYIANKYGVRAPEEE